MMLDPVNFATFWQAYERCRRNKRGSANAQRYEVNALENVYDLLMMVQNQSWKPGRTVCFITNQTKPREIHAADFADRVLHHWLVPHLESLWEPCFIHDSYANRLNKGTHKAVDRLQSFMRSAKDKTNGHVFYLQLDIANFFNRIHRPTLMSLLEKRILKRENSAVLSSVLIRLCEELLLNHPLKNVHVRSSAREYARVPEYKRLSFAPADTGLPIGNLTSQFFANVYLDELDQFIKRELKVRYYVRYVDDFVLVHDNEPVLRQWQQAIAVFLNDRLRLALKPTEVVVQHNALPTVDEGADFLGYIIYPQFKRIRKRVYGHFCDRLQQIEQRIIQQNTRGISLGWGAKNRENLRSVVASYRGLMEKAQTKKKIKQLEQRFYWLNALYFCGLQQPRWLAQGVLTWQGQIGYFKQAYGGFDVLIQKGNQCLWLPQKTEAMADFQRFNVSQDRDSGAYLCSLKVLHRLRGRLRYLQRPHVFMAESGYLSSGIKQRVLRLMWVNNKGEMVCLNQSCRWGSV